MCPDACGIFIYSAKLTYSDQIKKLKLSGFSTFII